MKIGAQMIVILLYKAVMFETRNSPKATLRMVKSLENKEITIGQEVL
jgi:hypothetical protein